MDLRRRGVGGERVWAWQRLVAFLPPVPLRRGEVPAVVCVCVREREGVCLCVCVCERERERGEVPVEGLGEHEAVEQRLVGALPLAGVDLIRRSNYLIRRSNYLIRQNQVFDTAEVGPVEGLGEHEAVEQRLVRALPLGGVY